MFKNYILVALRNLVKQKLFTAINIAGLVIGLMALVLANGLVNHEQNYDTFFPDNDRIYVIGGIVNPEANQPIRFMLGVPSPVQPLVEANVPGVEYSARLWQSERVARVGDRRFYQDVRFTDPDFLKIFAMDFIAGDAANALATRDGLVITESAAKKYFGDTDALGQIITIDNRLDLKVNGIISDIPRNSHFTNTLIGAIPFEFLARIEIYEELTGATLNQVWGGTSAQNYTYLKLEEGVSLDLVNASLTQLYQTFVPEQNDFQIDYFLAPLSNVNNWVWDALGVPVPQSIRILGILILLVAIINYSNLTNAQYMGRIREIGLRKSLGSSRKQLFFQFFTESVAVATFALIIAVTLSILTLEPLNDLTGKNFTLSGLFTPGGLALLAGTAVFTGFLGGVHPALKISKTPAAACLSDRGLTDGGRGKLRNLIVAFQFGIAILLASSAAVIYAQNQHVDTHNTLFDRDHIVLLDRVGRDGVAEKYETMKTELLRIPGVESMTASNNVPYEQSSRTTTVSRVHGETASEVSFLTIYTDHDFMSTYHVPILAGRDFNPEITLDTFFEAVEGEERQGSVNIILNRLAVTQLGWDSPEQALDGRFFFSNPDSPTIEHRIAGVIADFNYQGTFSQVRPMIFYVRPAGFQTAALRISDSNINDTVNQIDAVWNNIHPDFPLARSFLDDQFNQTFSLIRMLATVLGGFALVAVFVAFIGLFGLSAFVTKARTKEIGIRKILGATVPRLIKLVVYQISIPILAAIIPAALLAWAAMTFGYLQLFSDRIPSVVPFVSTAAVAVLVLAWGVVSYHAWRVARTNPIHALRYE